MTKRRGMQLTLSISLRLRKRGSQVKGKQAQTALQPALRPPLQGNRGLLKKSELWCIEDTTLLFSWSLHREAR